MGPDEIDDFKKIITDEVETVFLTSNGGASTVGFEMGTEIHKRQLKVVVDGFCFSSCANYLFLAGKEKEVLENSFLGFHGGMSAFYDLEGEALEAALIEEVIGQDAGALERIFALKALKKELKMEIEFYNTIGLPEIARLHKQWFAIYNAFEAEIEAGSVGQKKPLVGWFPPQTTFEKLGVKNITTFWHTEKKENFTKALKDYLKNEFDWEGYLFAYIEDIDQPF